MCDVVKSASLCPRVDAPGAAMLDVNPDTIRFIARAAKVFQAQEQVTIPEDAPLSPADDWGAQALAAHFDNPAYQEAANTIADLEPDQQIQLVALMWLGRGDFDLEQWEEALELAEEQRTLRTADYVLATPLVASYLDEGLVLHGYETE